MPASLVVLAGIAGGCAVGDRDVSRCLVGAAFIDCGAGTPALRCSKDPFSCKWVSDGDPVGELTARGNPTDCSCSGDCPTRLQLGGFVYAHGVQPWTRARAMDLSVRVEGLGPQVPSISCSKCAGWCKGGGPCMEGAKKAAIRRQELIGTYVIEYERPADFGGWALELEVDVERDPMRARACTLYSTDVLGCKPREPVCATSGEVVLGRMPTAEAPAAHGRFSVKFPEAEISGTF